MAVSARTRLIAAADEAAHLAVHKMQRGDLKATGNLNPSPQVMPDLAPPATTEQAKPPRLALRPGQSLEMRLRELLLSVIETSQEVKSQQTLQLTAHEVPNPPAALPPPAESMDATSNASTIESTGEAPEVPRND